MNDWDRGYMTCALAAFVAMLVDDAYPRWASACVFWGVHLILALWLLKPRVTCHVPGRKRVMEWPDAPPAPPRPGVLEGRPPKTPPPRNE